MDSLGKTLINLFKQHRALLTRKLAVIGLFPGQDGLLYHLSVADGQTMSSLVEKMQIQHATLFNMVERMVKAGLLKKVKDPADGRASLIYLTEKGRGKLAELSIIWKDTDSQLSAGLSESEKKTLVKTLHKLGTNISRHA
jgi:DNA-binding MarR family transcriptional regulator